MAVETIAWGDHCRTGSGWSASWISVSRAGVPVCRGGQTSGLGSIREIPSVGLIGQLTGGDGFLRCPWRGGGLGG